MPEETRVPEPDSNLDAMADIRAEAAMERAARPHRFNAPTSKGMTGLVWANFALLVSVLFFSGMFYQRVADLELRVRTMQNTETLTIQIQDLKAEVQRLRDRMDKLLDRSSGAPAPAVGGGNRAGSADSYRNRQQ